MFSAKINQEEESADNEVLTKEVQILRQQVQILQMKCELMSQQNSSIREMKKSDSSGRGKFSAEESEKASVEKQKLLSGSGLLLETIKTLLVKCLEEGVDIGDSAIQSIRTRIDDLKKSMEGPKTLAGKAQSHNTVSSDQIESEIVNDSDQASTAPKSDMTRNANIEIAGDQFDLSFNMSLPPVMSLIDEVSALQSFIHTCTSDIKFTSTDNPKSEDISTQESSCEADIDGTGAEVSDRDSLGMDFSDGELAECYVEDDDTAMQGVVMKEQEIDRMLELTEQFHATIDNLKTEISTLQQDKSRLIKLQEKNIANKSVIGAKGVGFGSGHTSSFTSGNNAALLLAEENRIKKELREKNKLLDDKLKELRSKEQEYARVLAQKDRAVKDAEVLRKEVEESKKRRAELQKKMADQGTQHNAERARLQQAEMQSKRREISAQTALQRLENELSSKERVWKEQLAAKERESKKMREIAEKQQKVKQHREQYAPNKNKIPIKVNKPFEELSQYRVAELRDWVAAEVESQIVRNTAQEELKKELDLRAKASKQLQSMKQQKTLGAIGNALSQLDSVLGSTNSVDSEKSSNNEDEEMREMVIKSLEEEVRKRSKLIARHQGHLADLGSVVEKRRFSQLTDMREAKVVMSCMFDVLTKDKYQQIRALETKLASHEAQLELHKKPQASLFSGVDKVNSAVSVETTVNSGFERALVAAVAPKARLPLHAPVHNKIKSKVVQKSRVDALNVTCKGHVKNSHPSKAVSFLKDSVIEGSNSVSLVLSNSGSSENCEDESSEDDTSEVDEDEEDFEEDDDVIDDLDESFYPEDEEDDDDDDYYERRRRRRPGSQKTSSSSVDSEENTSFNDEAVADDENSEVKSKKPRKLQKSKKQKRDAELNTSTDSFQSTDTSGNDSIESISSGESLSKVRSKFEGPIPIDVPLVECTVKRLKELLQSRNLTQTGRKDDLIKRLERYELLDNRDPTFSRTG